MPVKIRADQTLLYTLAIVTGVVSGFGVYLFLLVIGFVQHLGYGGSGESEMAALARATPAWLLILFPALGGLAVGLLVRWAMPNRRNESVADVIEACAVRGGRMGLRNTLVGAASSALSIGAGASVGREGPAVHLGAGLAAWLGARLSLSRSHSLTLVGCGVAAAVAASFNAPIAGVLFALEVVVGNYALSSFAPVVIASVAGTMVCRHLSDANPAFVGIEAGAAKLLELPEFALLGVICGLTALALHRSVFLFQGLWTAVVPVDWLRPCAAGAVLGVAAIWLPEILGTGYGTTHAALTGSLALPLVIVLLVAKIVFTGACLGGGFGGGIFSPALFVGAMTGSGVALAANHAGLILDPGAFALAGMAGTAAAVLGAPISTILIVFELTANFELTVAVMATATIATLVYRVAGGMDSFFNEQIVRRGVHLESEKLLSRLRGASVESRIKRNFLVVDEHRTIGELKQQLLEKQPGAVLLERDSAPATLGLGYAGALRLVLTEAAEVPLGGLCDSFFEPRVMLVNSSLASAVDAARDAPGEFIVMVDDLERPEPAGVLWKNDIRVARHEIQAAG